MVDFHRLKNLGTDIIGRAGDIAEQAKDKVVPLAEQAKEKVVPLAGKAKDVAAKGVDKAAGGLDSATGHKYHDKLGAVAGNRDKNPATDSAAAAPPVEPHAEGEGAGSVADTALDGDGVDDSALDGDGVDGSALDDGALDDSGVDEHPPTPSDMPPHRPADEAN